MIHDWKTCTYGPGIAGVDVSIDGDIWAGSPLDKHLDSEEHRRVCVPRFDARRAAERFARDRLCIEVREVRQAGRCYVVVRATTRRWGDSAAHEQWVRIPRGWAAHIDEIDEAIRYAIGDES